MRFRFLTGVLLVLLVIAGCQGPPPEIVFIVISPTPAVTDDVAVTEVVTTESTAEVAAVTEAVPPTQMPVATATPSLTVTAPSPSVTTTTPAPAGPTALPPAFPTPVIAEVQVAEQLFEHGRMFWIEPIGQIWVLRITGEGRGTWEVYEDTFEEGELETDPNLVPPDGLYQPERGFGKLWRESDTIRQDLGWGVTPEFGYVSRYEYHAGGTVDASGNYQPGFGYHIVFSLGGELFRFNEGTGTWQLGNN